MQAIFGRASVGREFLSRQARVGIVRAVGGSVAVEFALLFPILIAVLFSIVEWGFVVYDKAIITNASREGARRGIVFVAPTYRSKADIEATATAACTGSLITMSGTISCTSLATLVGAGTFAAPAIGDRLSVQVQTTYNGTALLALYNMLVGPITLTETTVMQYE